ncbi:glutathione S-transferase family protein [Rhizobium sp. CRIBSB]|nr:glutathione S-transferase family protein [Rhizobium sp. CRIBSB]
MSGCTLFHFAFDPASRVARLALGEARVEFDEAACRPWEPDCPLSSLNPSGMPPVLQVADKAQPLTLCESAAILGWIEDRAGQPFLINGDAAERAEIRRLVGWFQRRFSDEVDAVLLHERMEKPLLRLGSPDARALREGRTALKAHLAVLEPMIAARDWLAGRRLSQGDLVAGAHLSVLDYFGEVPWATIPALKTWYMRLKSRPCFRPLLADRFPGVQPVAWYADLDF